MSKLKILKENRQLQLTLGLSLILAILIFIAGRSSVDVPTREVMCSEIIKSNAILIDTAKTKEKEYSENIRLLHDEETKACQKRITEELDKFKEESPNLDCRICKAMAPQCKRKKTPICK